jgi:hypothetical protein
MLLLPAHSEIAVHSQRNDGVATGFQELPNISVGTIMVTAMMVITIMIMVMVSTITTRGRGGDGREGD